jgi:hypothetical protein
MKYPVLAVALFFFAFSFPVSIRAQHIGFGGHIGGGFSARGFSSGGASGHAIGRSFGRMFGRHAGSHGLGRGKSLAASEEPPLAGAVFLRGKVLHMPNPTMGAIPAARRLPRGPRHEFFFGQSIPPTPRRHFGNTFCGGFFPFPERRRLLSGDFNCFDGGFFFDSFFIGGFIGGRARFQSILATSGLGFAAEGVDWGSGSAPGSTDREDARPASPRDARDPVPSEPPVTLLQLGDGSMYGVTDYWVEGSELHYVTNYGAKTSLPLERVDLEATRQLNAERGVSFVLASKRPDPQ